MIGPLADSTRDIEGGWTVEGLFGGGGKSHPVTVLAGLKNRLGRRADHVCAGPRAVARIFRRLFDAMHGQEAAAAADREPKSPTGWPRPRPPRPMQTW